MMKRTLLLLLAALISTSLVSCENSTGDTVGGTDTTASASGGGYAALKPHDGLTSADIPSPYDGKVVYMTDTHVISEDDGKYILYTVSGEKVRTLTDFGEVSYHDNGEVKTHCVLLTSASAYTLDSSGLVRVDGTFPDAYILGDYIISGSKLYTGNFERIDTFSYTETEQYGGFAGGAVITGISRYADTPEIPHGGEISSRVSVFYLEAIDTLPVSSRRLCTLYMGVLHESDGRLYLDRGDTVYRFPVIFGGDIITALDYDSGILIRDDGVLHILTLRDISSSGDAVSPPYVKATLSRVIQDGGFNGMTVLRHYILDSDGEPLLASSDGSFEVLGDILAEYLYYSEGDIYSCSFALYDNELRKLDGSPFSHMYSSGDRVIAYSNERRHVLIYSKSGELLYESGEVRDALLLEEFGAAVLTLENKVQFISFDGVGSEKADGWYEGLIHTGVSTLMFPTYSEKYGTDYYPVCFIDGKANKTLYFWYAPETGHIYKETIEYSAE